MEGNKARSLAWMGVLTALLFTGQVVMSFLPNLEIVSLLIILYTIFFGKKVFWMIYGFVFLEGFLYGFGMWWFQYLYIWSILAMVVLLLRNNTSALFWSIISGFFGLSFGALCTLPYLFTGGPAAAFSYWVSGLGFDLTHCIGNMVLCLVLFKPLYALLQKVFPT
ncbi:MAG: hypothetical protein SOZ12_04105 [Anaerotignum sp.]|nr:hypothetical protein [Anaerotignum sp.]MDY3926503.1 hypothetical protein [Anaerotignum sp.]